MTRLELTLRYCGAMLLVAVFVIAAFVMQSTLEKNESERLALVNSAGRQRMLSQRILAYSWKYFMAQGTGEAAQAGAILSEATTEMEAAHQRLLGQADGSDAGAYLSAEIRDIFFNEPFKLDERVRSFLGDAHKIRTFKPGSPDCAQALDRIDALAVSPLLAGLDALVSRYQHEGEARAQHLRRFQTLALVAILGLLLLVAGMIFRPMVDTVCREKARMHILNSRLENLAVTDELTQTMNRRKFDDIFMRESELNKRYGTPLTVVMFDIDHFKQINDKHGHLTGDVVLSEVSNLVRENIRATDYLFRWGGEEFALLLPQTEGAAATTLAEKLRGLIAERRFRNSLAVTASFGIAEYVGQSQAEVMSEADKALYRAKHEGRNRVVTAWT